MAGNRNSPWPHREAELTRLWDSGLGRNAIARKMRLTRGQIAGKAMRLNLHHTTFVDRPVHAGSFEDIAGRSRFHSQVRGVGPESIMLKHGRDSRKIGARVTKGDWRGFPIFTLTLEERATCSRSCTMWLTCYGNSMGLARRWRWDWQAEEKLWEELTNLQSANPRGFLVRLHILGDFPNRGAVEFWHDAIVNFPALHIFGYSAWPHGSRVGAAVKNLRDMQWNRFAVRSSGASTGPRTLVVDRAEDKPAEAILCPAQTGATRSCATCGLCWSPAARAKPIAFLRH